MTVRFKCRSEYQKSYGVPRSRSVSPQRSAPLAGLRSDQMGISREPGLQRRRRLGPLGAAQSCISLLAPPDVQQQAEPDAPARRKSPSAASRSRSAHRKEHPPPASPADPGSPSEPATPAGPRPAADSEPPERPDPGSSVGANGKSVKPRPLQPDSQPRPSGADEPSEDKVDKVLQWRAGIRPGGQRSGVHRSEYNKQFGWKNPLRAESPLLTAEQVLYSSSRAVPPFKTNPIAMETEYRRSFPGVIQTTGPSIRKHLEHERVPLFHTQTANRRRREDAQKKPLPRREGDRSPLHLKATPPHPHRMLTEYESSFRSPLRRNPNGGETPDPVTLQMKELRQTARSHRHRAWGTNFSRVHLGQLTSEHNTLWEPTDTTDSHISLSTPRLTSSLSTESGSSGPSCVEKLDLASNSSKKSSVVGVGQTHHTHKKTQRNTETKRRSPPGPPAERRTAWEEEEEENTDEEEGRLPTPRLKTRPVQRTHHDLTTPATGGALLVGNLKPADDSSPHRQQRCGSAVSMAAGDGIPVTMSTKRMEAWSENSPTSSNPSPDHKPPSGPPSKPIRGKHPSQSAPPPQLPASLHGIQGTLRNPEFQHNGELGLRFRERPCSGGGCGSDEDDRLSVMSWRSAASCSAASAILERAQKRRENFWGKR